MKPEDHKKGDKRKDAQAAETVIDTGKPAVEQKQTTEVKANAPQDAKAAADKAAADAKAAADKAAAEAKQKAADEKAKVKADRDAEAAKAKADRETKASEARANRDRANQEARDALEARRKQRIEEQQARKDQREADKAKAAEAREAARQQRAANPTPAGGALIDKAKYAYITSNIKTASGRPSTDSGDELAEAMRGMDVPMAKQLLAENGGTHKDTWDGLNAGMHRMTIGNHLRKVIREREGADKGKVLMSKDLIAKVEAARAPAPEAKAA